MPFLYAYKADRTIRDSCVETQDFHSRDQIHSRIREIERLGWLHAFDLHGNLKLRFLNSILTLLMRELQLAGGPTSLQTPRLTVPF